MYLTYEEYQAMGGTIEDAAEFDDLEFGAEALINYYTFNRLKNDTNIPTEVKRLTKYLIDLAKKKADLDNFFETPRYFISRPFYLIYLRLN